MDIKKIVPTNWFSREESQTGNLFAQQEASSFGSLVRLHQEIDRLFMLNSDVWLKFCNKLVRSEGKKIYGN